MPLYEYRCPECGHRFEVLQAVGANAESLACPRCATGGPAKQPSTFATTKPRAEPSGSACGCFGTDSCPRPS